ncbi:MAG: NUDIX hydrolase [Actinobacteria bacterium]|nr:NUDIX hydrolase [Actinomycetota bacterium]
MNDRLFEKKINSKQIFNGEIVGLYYDEVELPNGRITTREKITHPGAVGIVPVTGDNKIILVKQYRYPVEDLTIEIPAGKLDKDELPSICARRELEEEVGAVDGKIILLSSFYTTPGFCNEVLHLYLALDFKRTANSLDDDEFLEIIEPGLEEALTWIRNGKIKDSKTIIGILMARDFLDGRSER